jgi:hypothetical protein
MKSATIFTTFRTLGDFVETDHCFRSASFSSIADSSKRIPEKRCSGLTNSISHSACEATFLFMGNAQRRGVSMREAKTAKIFLDEAGSFLGRGEGCLIVRSKEGKVEKYPLFENQIGEVHVRIGNSVSSAALATCAFWGIDLLISTQRGNPVAYLRSRR